MNKDETDSVLKKRKPVIEFAYDNEGFKKGINPYTGIPYSHRYYSL